MLNSERNIIKRIIFEYCQRQKSRNKPVLIRSIEELEERMDAFELQDKFETLLKENLDNRRIDILKMRCGNYTYREIGGKYNITTVNARDVFLSTMRVVSGSNFIHRLYFGCREG